VRGAILLWGEDLLYSRLSPWGKSYYIASFPGGKAAMGEKLLYNTSISTAHYFYKNMDLAVFTFSEKMT
jgi:hypothetical protein